MSITVVGKPIARMIAAAPIIAARPWRESVQRKRASRTGITHCMIWPARKPTQAPSEILTRCMSRRPTPIPVAAITAGMAGAFLAGSRPKSAGTSTGPSEKSTVATGAFAASPPNPKVNAAPAPSTISFA